MKFKEGDVIELTQIGLALNNHESIYNLKKIGKVKILDVKKGRDWDYEIKLKGIQGLCYFNEDEIQKVKEKEMKFKVGDKVKIKSSYVERDGSVMLIDKAIFTIEKISGEHIYLQGVDYPYFTADDLEKPEKLEVTTSYKDPKYCMVRDNEDGEWTKAILINDNSDLNIDKPFGVVASCDEKEFFKGEKIGFPLAYKYAKPIPEKKYKAYEEPKIEWIGKEIIDKLKGTKYIIRAIGKSKRGKWYLTVSHDSIKGDIGLKKIFKECTWLDGSPCGELV